MKKVLALIIALMFAFAVTAAFAADAPKADTKAPAKMEEKKADATAAPVKMTAADEKKAAKKKAADEKKAAKKKAADEKKAASAPAGAPAPAAAPAAPAKK